MTADDTVVTRAADNAILNGVTRLAVLDIIAREGYRSSSGRSRSPRQRRRAKPF